jgi:hypothetical protein
VSSLLLSLPATDVFFDFLNTEAIRFMARNSRWENGKGERANWVMAKPVKMDGQG